MVIVYGVKPHSQPDISYIMAVKFYWWRKPEYPEKTDLPQVTDKLSHNVLLGTPHHEQGLKLTTLVVIGTDCIGSCKCNYHTIMTTTENVMNILQCTYVCVYNVFVCEIVNVGCIIFPIYEC